MKNAFAWATTIGAFILLIIVGFVAWFMLGHSNPKIAAIIIGGAAFVVFGAQWLQLAITTARVGTSDALKETRMLVGLTARIAIGSVIFVVILGLLAALAESELKPLYDTITSTRWKELLNPASFRQQFLLIAISGILTYMLVSKWMRGPVMVIGLLVCGAILIGPWFIAKNPGLVKASEDFGEAGRTALEAATIRTGTEAEAAKKSAQRDSEKQLAKDRLEESIKDIIIQLDILASRSIDSLGRDPLEMEILEKGVVSYTDQFDNNPKPVPVGTKLETPVELSAWLEHPLTHKQYVPINYKENRAQQRYVPLSSVIGSYNKALLKRKADTERLGKVHDSEPKPSKREKAASNSEKKSEKIPTTIPQFTTPPVSLPPARAIQSIIPPRSTVTRAKVELRRPASGNDWVTSEPPIVLYPEEFLIIKPEPPTRENVMNIRVRCGMTEPPSDGLKLRQSADGNWYGVGFVTGGKNTVSEPLLFQLAKADELTVYMEKVPR